MEELKEERLRIEEKNRQIAIAEQEKKEQAEIARKEAAAAYRALVDRKVSEQVRYLEEQSAQRKQAELEIRRKKEEKQQERAAQKAAEESRRKEEKLRRQQEKESMQQARELAEAQRMEKERQLKEEKKAELARLDFEKNKDKIIKAQRREIQRKYRAEAKKLAKQEAANRRYERKALFRRKVKIYFRDIPSRIALIPSRIGAAFKRLADRWSRAFSAYRTRVSERSEARREVRAAEAEKKREIRDANARVRLENREKIAAAKAERKEAAAVAARLKKTEAADRKAKAVRAKEARKEERIARRKASKEAFAAGIGSFFATVRNAFASIGKWVSGVFSTTQSWIKRLFLLISGIITFILMIPVRAVKALFSIPRLIAGAFNTTKEKQLAKAEIREYKKEQKRIAREKTLVSGQSRIETPVAAVAAEVPAVTASGAIRNLEKEAPFTYSEKSLKDILKRCRAGSVTVFIASLIQAAALVAVPVLISDFLSSYGTLDVFDIPVSLLKKAAVIIGGCLVANLMGRASLTSLLRKVSKEMRRIEFSIRKERDRNASLSDEIVRVQELAYAKYDLIFDIGLLIASVIAICVSSPFNAAVLLAGLLASVRNRRAADKRLANCKSVPEAVSVREAVSLDWARKLRVNKLLGRGNDAYDNVRNSVLDVNIRVLARRDVETDRETFLRTLCYAVIASAVLVTVLLPLGDTAACVSHLIAAVAAFVIGPAAIKSASEKYAILSDRHDLSKTVSSVLSSGQASGDN